MRLVFILLSGSLSTAAIAQPPKTALDGKWWLNQTEDARLTFMEGAEDCYYSLVQPHAYPNDNDEDSIRKVTRYLDDHPPVRSQPLVTLLRRLRPEHKIPTRTERGGEGFGERHGVMDGSIWAGLNLNERRIYVQAYLACKIAHLRYRPTRSVAFIEASISKWYGLEGKYVSPEGDLPDGDESHEATKIGDLIDRIE